MQRIRVVLFDLGGTLWHIPKMPPREEIRSETVRRLTTQLEDWGFLPNDDARFLGRDIRLTIEEAESRAFAGALESPDYTGIVRSVAAEKGYALSDGQAHELWEKWNLGGKFFGRRLFDDALPTLNALRRKGFRLAIVTNRSFGGGHFHEELEECGLKDLFDAVAVSSEVGYMKPHPAIYHAALDELGATPAEAVHVGDSLVADVGGAKALGMHSVWRRGRLRENADHIRPDFIIESLSELVGLPVLRGLNSDT